MKLQTLRRLEQFLTLAGLPDDQVDARMEFSHPPLRIFTELVDDYFLLSIAAEVEPAYQPEALETMLRRCLPERTLGTPLRTCFIGNLQLLSCTLSEEDDLTHWLHCLSVMQRMMQTVSGVKK